jgi:hypothetical protein
MTGGNFWQGAVTGLVVSGLNHVAHKTNSSVRVYDDDGEYVGKIKVLKYKNTGDGVQIELGFKATRNSKYTDYNWVQTVRTDHPLGGTSQTYNDPRPNDDNLPFYYTNSELAGQKNTSRGYNVEFYDSPHRDASNSWWKGELSLVGKFNNTYHQLHTFNYGFDTRNYQSFVAPLITKRPSGFQLNSF